MRFPLRTPPLYLVAFWLMSAFTALAVGFLLFGLGSGAPPFIIFITVSLLVFVIASWATTEPYRVGGIRGELVIEGDALSVPGARRGEVIRLPLAGLAFQRAPMHVRFSLLGGALPVGTWQRGEVIVLRSGATSRTLSTLTSKDPLFADKLMSVLSERTIPAPELDKLTAIMAEASRLFASGELRTRVSAVDAQPAEDAELERRIDDALRSEKE